MKKVLLVTQMFPPKLGGGPNYYYRLCENLPCDRIVVLADKDDKLKLDLSGFTPKFKIYYKSFFYKSKLVWPKWFKLLFELNNVIHEEKPDIIWAGEVIPAGTVVWFLSRLHNLPYFVSTHGADVLNPQVKPGIKGRWKLFLVRFILRHADFNTANTEFTRLQLSKLGVPHERSIVVYPCPVYVPTNENLLDETQEQSVVVKIVTDLKKHGYKVLLTAVGHLVKRKGIDSVIEALPKVWQKDQSVAYVVTGAGPYKSYLEERAKELDKRVGRSSRIIFTGPVSEQELKFLFSRSDVYIMLPRIINGLTEGFGIVYIEASSFSKPVIGSRVAGVPEAIVEFYDNNYTKATGLLVDNVHSTSEVSEKIIMLIKDEHMAYKFGENGKRWTEKFKWEEQVKILVEKIRD